MSFINMDIDNDPHDLAGDVHSAIRSRWPSWEGSDNHLETWMIDAFTRLGSEVADLIIVVGEEIFKEFGRTIIGLPSLDEVPASADSTWTMKDNAGYTIQPGTQVGVRKAGDELVAFQVVNQVVVPPGSTDTGVGEVQLAAVIPGEHANGLGGTVEMITALDIASAIVLVAPTSGGADSETDSEYMARLVDEVRLLAPRPILPPDFEVLMRRNPSVFRAKAIDGWDPTADTLGNERYIGAVALDVAGEDVSSGVKTALEADLNARRELNFVFEMGAPTYATINVAVAVRCYPGYDPASVDAEVTAALQSYLSPANRGRVDYGGDSDIWLNDTVVRYLEVAEVINRVVGVNYIEPGTLLVNAGTVDVNLTGKVPLTRPGTMTVTANAA